MPCGDLAEGARRTHVKLTLDDTRSCGEEVLQRIQSSRSSGNYTRCHGCGQSKRRERARPASPAEHAARGHRERVCGAVIRITTVLANGCERTFCMFNHMCWLKAVTVYYLFLVLGFLKIQGAESFVRRSRREMMMMMMMIIRATTRQQTQAEAWNRG